MSFGSFTARNAEGASPAPLVGFAGGSPRIGRCQRPESVRRIGQPWRIGSPSGGSVGSSSGGFAIGLGPAGLAPFLVAGAILGSGLGGVTVADRVLMLRLSPPERVGEFFGLYGLVGKGSQVIGTLLYGLILFLFVQRLGIGAYQVAVLSLLVTMLIGMWLIWPVRDDWAGSEELAVQPAESVGPIAPATEA